MPDTGFLELIETIEAEAVRTVGVFNRAKDGVGIRSFRFRETKAYKEKLIRATIFVQEISSGKRPANQLMEALTTDDFPLLFGDVLDRQVLANFRAWPNTYQNYSRQARVRDFRSVKRFEIDGAEDVLEVVEQQEAYPGSSLSESEYTYAVRKYGRRMPFAWETIINDDLDALTDVPARFGKAAARSREKFVTELFVDSTGPHGSLYTGGNNNVITSNPVLSIAGLQTGLLIMAAQLDTGGDPILIDTVELVVPPALEIIAENMLNALQLNLTAAGGTTTEELVTVNWMRSRMRLSVNPYIPVVASSSNGDTSWFLFANPNGSRPALEFGLLRGHEEPQLFMKAPNAVRVGGGMVDAMAGDFGTDSIEYKVRDVFGGSRMNPKVTAASDGSGS